MDEFSIELIMYGAMMLVVVIGIIAGIISERKFILHQNEASKVGKHKDSEKLCDNFAECPMNGKNIKSCSKDDWLMCYEHD